MSPLFEIVSESPWLREVIGPDEAVYEAARRMLDIKKGALAVVEENVIIGIISERDIIAKMVVMEQSPRRTCIRDVMTYDPVCVEEGEPLAQVIDKLRTYKFRQLPVRNSKGGFVRMLTCLDLIEAEIDRLNREQKELLHFLQLDSVGLT